LCDAAAKYDVESFPTLVVVNNDEEQTVTRYDGELGYQQLDKFLSTFAPKSAKSTKAGAGAGAKSEKAEPKVSPSPSHNGTRDVAC
jgi:thioredoxin-like negative regulator of GroEL